jgi:hypothetical protein
LVTQERMPVFGGKHHMDHNLGQGLGHGLRMGGPAVRFNPFRVVLFCDCPRVGAGAPTPGYMIATPLGLPQARYVPVRWVTKTPGHMGYRFRDLGLPPTTGGSRRRWGCQRHGCWR